METTAFRLGLENEESEETEGGGARGIGTHMKWVEEIVAKLELRGDGQGNHWYSVI